MFREEGIFNYSTMLMRDDLGLLLLGAREAIYAVDSSDISVKKAAVRTFKQARQDNRSFFFFKHHLTCVTQRMCSGLTPDAVCSSVFLAHVQADLLASGRVYSCTTKASKNL